MRSHLLAMKIFAIMRNYFYCLCIITAIHEPPPLFPLPNISFLTLVSSGLLVIDIIHITTI